MKASLRFALLTLALALLFAEDSFAGACPGETPGCGFSLCATPARPVPTYLWGELQPADSGPLPRDRDSTAFNEFTVPYGLTFPQWMDLDIAGDRLFALAAWGVQVWDISDSATGLPRRGTVVNGYLALPEWSSNPEIKQPLRAISASATQFAVGGVADIGLSLWAVNGGAPYPLFQDSGFSTEAVALATRGGLPVAIAADSRTGLRLYDIGAASSLSRCLASSGNCPGVRLPTLPATNALYLAAQGSVVAYSRGTVRGLTILSLDDPTRSSSALADRPVYGLALWRFQTQLYLAARSETAVVVFRVDEPSLALTQLSSTPVSDGATWHPLYASSADDGTPFVYVGSDNRCSGGPQREWLFDVSVPSSPRDITPASLGSTGYWGWYYRGNASGFNQVSPRSGRFHGKFFYRAALSIFDVHRRDTAPTAPRGTFLFEPAHPSTGEPVKFTALVPGAQDYFWALPGATPSQGEGRTITVTYDVHGVWPAGLIACSPGGCVTADQDVTVSPAYPLIDSIVASPNPARLGTPVTLTASVSGRAPLSFRWQVPGGSRTGNPATWTPTRQGTFPIDLQVTNTAGLDTASLDLDVIEQPFFDVPEESPIYQALLALYRRGVPVACGPDLFCPNDPLLRGDAVAILLRAKRGSTYRPPAARGLFADVPRTDPQAPVIEHAYQLGIVQPCSTAPLRFCPSSPIARRDLAIALLRTARGAGFRPPAARGLFSDVPRTAAYAPFAEHLYRINLLPSCGAAPLRFCPSRQFPRGLFADALVRLLALR